MLRAPGPGYGGVAHATAEDHAGGTSGAQAQGQDGFRNTAFLIWESKSDGKNHLINEAVKTGTTTIADCGTIPPYEHSVIRAVTDIGARGVLARMMLDIHEAGIPKRLQENTRECLANTERFIKDHHLSANGRVVAALDIQQVCFSSEELIAGIKDFTERYDIGIQTHAAIVNFEVVEFTRQRTGMRDIEYLNHVGVLGPRLTAAHMALARH